MSLFLYVCFSLPPLSLLQVMTCFALQRRLQNVSVTISSAEPGYVSIAITVDCVQSNHYTPKFWFSEQVKTELNRGWQDKKFLSMLNDIGYSSKTMYKTNAQM